MWEFPPPAQQGAHRRVLLRSPSTYRILDGTQFDTEGSTCSSFFDYRSRCQNEKFATAEVAKSTAEDSRSASDGPSAASSAEEVGRMLLFQRSLAGSRIRRFVKRVSHIHGFI